MSVPFTKKVIQAPDLGKNRAPNASQEVSFEFLF
jgi:hypothetical protein